MLTVPPLSFSLPLNLVLTSLPSQFVYLGVYEHATSVIEHNFPDRHNTNSAMRGNDETNKWTNQGHAVSFKRASKGVEKPVTNTTANTHTINYER